MASLQHSDALRLPAALLVLSLLAGCGGDRSRAAGDADTTGTAVVTPDSAATPVTDTTAPASRDSAQSVAPAATADTGVKSASAAPATRAPAKAPAAAAPRPAPSPGAGKQVADAQAGSARDSATAPTPQAQDRSKATTGAADAPLRDAYHKAPRDTVSQAVYSGWKQFNLNCARCHGEDVEGTTIAPHLIVSLKPGGPVATKESFVQTVCAGRPEKGMPGWCALGLEMGKIGEIYEYVKGRSDAKIGPGRPAVREG